MMHSVYTLIHKTSTSTKNLNTSSAKKLKTLQNEQIMHTTTDKSLRQVKALHLFVPVFQTPIKVRKDVSRAQS